MLNNEIKFDLSRKFASIEFCETKTKENYDPEKLRDYCVAKEIDEKEVFVPDHGKITLYPAEAWLFVYGIKL